MEMVRSFLPVGQGAFFTEQFENGVNIVFDCGSQTSVEIVNKIIESTFDEGEDIYAVFISHLHSDHINGLEFLLKHCKVKTLYLPYLTPQNILISELVQEVTQSGCSQFVKDFIHDSENTLKMYCERNDCSLPQIKYVLTEDDANKFGQQIESNIKQYLFSGETINVLKEPTKSKWEYKPYNVENTERKKKLIDELDKIGVDSSDLESIKEVMSTKRGRAEIRKAYEAVPGGINTNSMVVYSGPGAKERNTVVQRFVDKPFLAWRYCDCCDSMLPGCLFMGDFDASEINNYASMEKYYEDYWMKIGVLQIPHHGSKYSFNDNLLSKACWFIISAGSENKYKHPHTKVLKKLILCRQPFAWVTEKVNSSVQFVVSSI